MYCGNWVIQQLLHTSTKKRGLSRPLVRNQEKTFGTGLKGKIFGSVHPMYMGLKILLLVSGHVFFMITKSGL